MFSRSLVGIMVVLITATGMSAAALQTDASFDRWVYPFNATPGTRVTASTFGAVQIPAFDDLDAQILLGFDTAAAGVPPARTGLYQITRAAVELTTATDGAFELDNTYDSFTTYLDAATDEDPGRPIELYGVGFRNGFLAAGFGPPLAGPPVFEETEAFAFPGPPAAEVRHAFASDYDQGQPRDVSNHARSGYDPDPWAIGDVPGLAAGSPVPVDTPVLFDLDLDNPNVVEQLQSGLDGGGLFFAVGSRHESVQGSSQGIPSFHLAGPEGITLGPNASLALEYELIPEPSACSLVGLGLVLLTGKIRRRR